MIYNYPKNSEPCPEVGMRPEPCRDTIAPPNAFQRMLQQCGHLNDMIHTVERYEESKARIGQIVQIARNLVIDLKNASVPYVEASQAECYLRNSVLWLDECIRRIDEEITQVVEAQK